MYLEYSFEQYPIQNVFVWLNDAKQDGKSIFRSITGIQ